MGISKPRKSREEVSKVRSKIARKQYRDCKGRFCTKQELDKEQEVFYFVITKPKRTF